MGSIDSRLTRLENDPDSDFIELRGGGRFWYEPHELYKSFFLYYMSCLGSDYRGEGRPPTPPIFEAIAQAEDREAAMSKVSPSWRNWRTDHRVKSAFDLDVLVDEGRIEPFDWVRYIHDHSPDGPHDYPGRVQDTEVGDDG